ncbi:MAG: aminotransferase class I/II-fold pyridoxal phosphate-dependent enzyme [Candidatus Micrarchaeota archaeon]|nr:aminotransferase class I/II-fold pyridoxal phosphate-dependent enzyme [Candidatus Micrarchaeota archaeon]
MVELSEHFKEIGPSAIRMAQIKFMERKDDCIAINVAIGNVSLPMHPAMIERMKNLNAKDSPFFGGVVRYTETVGTKEANEAFLNILRSSGIDTTKLYSQVVDGGSQAMELAILGTTKDKDQNKKPLMLIEPIYANYVSFAKRLSKKIVCIKRELKEDGSYTLPKLEDIEKVIKENKPGAIVVIPYDNPTGQYISKEQMIEIAKLAVKYDMWIISDEAYRELHYNQKEAVSIWKITNKIVHKIEGRRISIESSSKVWNACGLRIGALITDNLEFHKKAVAEYTANLCANAIGQYIFGALAHLTKEELLSWYEQQRRYYKELIFDFQAKLKKELPGAIISKPDSAIYSVIDLKKIVPENFNTKDFINWCAEKGKVNINGKDYTLLVSPMEGFFYSLDEKEKNIVNKQLRIAYVLEKKEMDLVPILLKKLLENYIQK